MIVILVKNLPVPVTARAKALMQESVFRMKQGCQSGRMKLERWKGTERLS